MQTAKKVALSKEQEAKVDQMEDELYQFSQTLDTHHFEKALDLRDELREEKVAAADQTRLVKTTELLQRGFKQFP